MKKLVVVCLFVLVIASLGSCKSTKSCSSIEKQELKTNINQPNFSHKV